MRDNNYITIQCWMMNRLKLAGNELIVYAMIYGYSQNGEATFRGSLSDIAESLQVNRTTITRILRRLEERGLISRISATDNHTHSNEYRANLDCLVFENEGSGEMHLGGSSLGAKCTYPSGEMHLGGRCKMTPPINNNDFNNKSTNKNSCSEPLKKDSKPALNVDDAENVQTIEDPVFIEIPTVREGEVFQVRQSLVTLMKESYPAVDVESQLREMKAWSVTNRINRKTIRGMPKFINSWLAREQDKAGRFSDSRPKEQRINMTSSNEKIQASFERIKQDPRYKGDGDITFILGS